jgi:chemotaxis protein CheC
MKKPILNDKERDALAEIANIGAGHATVALYQMTQKVLRLEATTAELLPLAEIPARLGPPEDPVLGIYFKIFGQSRASLLVAFPQPATQALLGELAREPQRGLELSEMQRSAALEVGNILASAYLSAISNFLELSFLPSIPDLAYDMAGSVCDLLVSERAGASDEALTLFTSFSDAEGTLRGHYLLLPDVPSLNAIFSKLKLKSA